MCVCDTINQRPTRRKMLLQADDLKPRASHRSWPWPPPSTGASVVGRPCPAWSALKIGCWGTWLADLLVMYQGLYSNVGPKFPNIAVQKVWSLPRQSTRDLFQLRCGKP